MDSKCLGVATEYGLYKIIEEIDVCTEFEILKVKVLIIFSAHRVFRPAGMDVSRHVTDMAATTLMSIPAWRETLYAEKNYRYFDFKHFKLYIHIYNSYVII